MSLAASEPAAALPNPYPVARLRFTYRVDRAIVWPEYEGSALRGLWGHALRRLACVTGAPNCAGCPVHAQCAYGSVFETRASKEGGSTAEAPRPYVLEPALDGPRELPAGHVSHFDLVLVGAARRHHAVLRAAFAEALTGRIGPAAGRATVLASGWLAPGDPAGPIQAATAPSGIPSLPLPPCTDAPPAARVHLRTPVRIKHAGRLLGARQLHAFDFLWALSRRTADITELHHRHAPVWHFDGLKAAIARIASPAADLSWRPLSRWSNRQMQHTDLSGVSGSFLLEGDLRAVWPMLILGEWLHVGGKATFGLGRYEVEPLG